MGVIQETSLADFVRSTMEKKGLTARAVEVNSSGAITHSYINKIKNGDSRNPSPAKLQGLAAGLGIPEETVFAITRGKVPNRQAVLRERFEVLTKKLDALPRAQKEHINLLIETVEREVDRLTEGNRTNLKMEPEAEAKFIKHVSRDSLEKPTATRERAKGIKTNR